MDEYEDFYLDASYEDRFERFDDYNVFEEREIMNDAEGYEEEFDDYLDSEAADFDADWREEA
tara:strand:+ start:1002 stop:1187 length:186 start_codon:yes stop_codon:yes gene_type:complete